MNLRRSILSSLLHQVGSPCCQACLVNLNYFSTFNSCLHPIVAPFYSVLQSTRASDKGKQNWSFKLFPRSRYDPASGVFIKISQNDKDGRVCCQWNCFHTYRMFLTLTASSACPSTHKNTRWVAWVGWPVMSGCPGTRRFQVERIICYQPEDFLGNQHECLTLKIGNCCFSEYIRHCDTVKSEVMVGWLVSFLVIPLIPSTWVKNSLSPFFSFSFYSSYVCNTLLRSPFYHLVNARHRLQGRCQGPWISV